MYSSNRLLHKHGHVVRALIWLVNSGRIKTQWFLWTINRLNLILKSLPNLVLVVHKHLDPSVISFFYSFNKILIKFYRSRVSCNCQSRSINGGNRLFEIYPTLDNQWYSHYLNKIENIIRLDICSRLQSLVLRATSPEFVVNFFV